MLKYKIPQIVTLTPVFHDIIGWYLKNKGGNLLKKQKVIPFDCRNEATRTPDPYVPNVVRYQLRYIPIA